MKTNPFRSLVYNALIRTTFARKLPLFSKIWNTLWRWQCRTYSGLVKSTLHGQPVILTNGHWYSLVCREYPRFNQPLYAIVKVLADRKPEPIQLVDVGAAVGDTVLFLEANFGSQIGRYLCIDGDKEFYGFQEYNLSSVKNKCINYFALLSDKEELISSIDKVDPTTGSAVGALKEQSETIDQILAKTGFGKVDVIKVDIDGYDGKALGGAVNCLKSDRPLVIFEWNTPYYELVGNSITQPFEVLSAAGYDHFLWFTNLGDFAFYTRGYDLNVLNTMQIYCKNQHSFNGRHYDVIAIHQNSGIDPNAIIHINENQVQKSRY